ncbi:MAG TPA: DnaJ C-terminal domain-containing protein [Gemmataceae bacterium]|jgi:DnaJ-class molecular chaperone|nr:DnaJ C-terminal domain-containing protein [Gemmataceae bacterium]
MPRDHYEVLGVSKSASADEIAKAYKKLARQHHPDRNPGDKQAESRFKEIQNAYDTLSDPKKKGIYDQFGTDVPPGAAGGGFPGGFQFPGGGGGQQIDPEMAQEVFRRMFGGGGGGGGFEDLFGGGGNRGRGRGRGRPQPSAETVDVEAHVPFLTAAMGGTIGLRVGDRDIDVRVPAGFEDGKKLRVAGQGEYGEDIVVTVRIAPHPYFRREGKDILIDVPISIPEAVVGGKVEVPTVAGKRVTVKVPPGTSSGSRVRLPGMGIGGGDQYLVMKVVVPKGKPDDRTKEIMDEYAKLHPDDVRIDVPWR